MVPIVMSNMAAAYRKPEMMIRASYFSSSIGLILESFKSILMMSFLGRKSALTLRISVWMGKRAVKFLMPLFLIMDVVRGEMLNVVQTCFIAAQKTPSVT